MGRAMLIIVAGVLVSVGITQTGLMGGMQSIDNHSANYAETVQAKNIAFMGYEQTVAEMRNDDSFRSGQRELRISDGTAHVEVVDGLSDDRIKLTSRGVYQGEEKSITFYLREGQADLVPQFEAALGLATNDYDLDIGGSADLIGHDASGTCESKPGLMVPPESNGSINGQTADNYFEGGSSIGNIDGSSGGYAAEGEIDFDPVSSLIKRLENQPGVEYPSGNYKGNMGTKENPGIFFVEDYTKLSGGIDDGHGIMVIRTNGELDMEGELDLKGNFNFNGLVIFENAYTLDGAGTPNIKGSVMVGKTANTGTVNIDLTGNIGIQYDCTARDYALQAVQGIVDVTQFAVLSVFE